MTAKNERQKEIKKYHAETSANTLTDHLLALPEIIAERNSRESSVRVMRKRYPNIITKFVSSFGRLSRRIEMDFIATLELVNLDETAVFVRK